MDEEQDLLADIEVGGKRSGGFKSAKNLSSFGVIGAMLQRKIDTDPEFAAEVESMRQKQQPQRPGPFSEARRYAKLDAARSGRESRKEFHALTQALGRFRASLDCNECCESCLGNVKIRFLGCSLCGACASLEDNMKEIAAQLEGMET